MLADFVHWEPIHEFVCGINLIDTEVIRIGEMHFLHKIGLSCSTFKVKYQIVLDVWCRSCTRKYYRRT